MAHYATSELHDVISVVLNDTKKKDAKMPAKAYPDTFEFEVSTHVIAAADPGHDRDNPLALAITAYLETRYHVSIHAGGAVLAEPYDDQSAELAADDDAPWYILDTAAHEFLEAFDSGSHDIVDFHDTWFVARRYVCAGDRK